MRQVLIGDVIAAARSLLDVPQNDRERAVSVLLYQAHAADKVMKRTGLPHVKWGNGSLMAAVSSRPKQAEPFFSDLVFLEAIHLTVEGIMTWKRAMQVSQHRHVG